MLLLLLPLLASGAPSSGPCCTSKTVGGLEYTLVREDSAALSLSCLSPCVYERSGIPGLDGGPQYCFARGEQTVFCGNATSEVADPRLIIVGRLDSETYPFSSSFSIPPLTEGLAGHSLTLLPGPPPTLVICGGIHINYDGEGIYKQSCQSYSGGQEDWKDYFTMRKKRRGHSASRIGSNSILIIGGENNDVPVNTAELVPGGGEYRLQHNSAYSCGIAMQDAGEMVITGGGNWRDAHGHVSRYSSTGFLGSLPDLKQERWRHACGYFTTSKGNKVLLVTGGSMASSSSDFLASTELLSLSSPRAWTQAAFLPKAASWLNIASLPGLPGLYCAGGEDADNFRDEVLKYDQENDVWEQVGRMNKARLSFAMVGADIQSFSKGFNKGLTP